jgi:hypothetical protein
MLTSFLFTRVYAQAYVNCVSANFMGFTSLLGGHCSHHFPMPGDKYRRFGLFDGTTSLHADIARADRVCC